MNLQLRNEEDILSETKPFIISKQLVMKAYQLVKENAGAAGVDRQSLADFDRNLKDNLYKLWNRMSSGSYFPEAVRAVSIPKKSGGQRILGVPTVADRIAQMVARLTFEPLVEPHFLKDSYGYRPNKSALDAIGVTRQRCWEYDWLVEFDVRGLFDNLDHELLMKAVKKHTENPWVILYIERWIKAPLQMSDGTCQARTRGVPQGGVISPVLSNLFLHYAFDVWVSKHYPKIPWCRYADDGILHCRTEAEAQEIRTQLEKRFRECQLELHPEKTKIIYCKDENRRRKYPNTQFKFLGYDFRCRRAKSSGRNKIFLSFAPAVAKEAAKSMRAKVRQSRLRLRGDLTLGEIAQWYNPILRGWIEYYGKYHSAALDPVWRHFNKSLIKWAMHKYKRFKGRKTKAAIFMRSIMQAQPSLFEHWKRGAGSRLA